MEDITKIRNSKGKVLMLIIPVILLVVMIFVYREYAKNYKDGNEPPVTLAPTPAGMGNGDPASGPSPEANREPTPMPSPAAGPAAGDSGNGGLAGNP